jgi:hypothetical protein
MNSLNKKNKSRGGQSKPSIEKARVRLWYKAVQARECLSDYELDKKFVWLDLYKGTGEAAKIFEKMKRKGASHKGNEYVRGFNELVTYIEAQPGYEGTEDLYRAKLWSLLSINQLSTSQIIELIDEALVASELERRSPVDIKGYVLKSALYSFPPSFDEVFRQTAIGMAPLTVAYLEILFCMLKKALRIPTLSTKYDPPIKSLALKRMFEQELSKWSDENPYSDFITRLNAIEIIMMDDDVALIPENLFWPICRIGSPIPVVASDILPLGISVTGAAP